MASEEASSRPHSKEPSGTSASEGTPAATTPKKTSPPTRFSFYDAQEVQLQLSASENKEEMEVISSKRFSFYDEVTRQELAEVKVNHLPTNTSVDSTEDILRSLQETEEQRMNILKTQDSPSLSKPPTATTPISSSRSLPSPRIQNIPAASIASAISSNSTSLRAQVQEQQETGSNPYEDAIKEALNLLRKHRVPTDAPPTTPVNVPTGSIPRSTPPTSVALNTSTAPPATFVGTKEVGRPRTPRELDRLLQHRQGSEDEEGDVINSPNAATNTATGPKSKPGDLADAYEEHKLKAKQRQERMAQYASRLQEFKSTLPSPQNQQPPQQQDKRESWQPHASSRHQQQPQHPELTTSNSTQEGDNMVIRQAPTNTDESAAFSDLSHSTKMTVEEEVQKGVERVLLAILERAHGSRGRAGSSSVASRNQQSSTANTQSMNDALSQAMHELLGSNSESQEDDYKLTSKRSTDSARRSERSVVDELLAEVEDEDVIRRAIMASTGSALLGQPVEEKKLDPHEVVHDRYHAIKEEEQDGIIVLETRPGPAKIEDPNPDEGSEDDDICTEDEETDRNTDDYSTGDDLEDDESQNDDNSNLERVLGPLSKKAGGTTGVVLDIEETKSDQSSNLLGGLSTVMNYVTSALTPEQQDAFPAAVADDHDDAEAMELMRTLCAHLLPFGVDQSNRLLDSIPKWDESNPNEAGYRIIRLSKSQLRRVERAFETMINGLKLNSERRLNNGTDVEKSNGYDANFVKELQEAERLLDDDEKRQQAALQNASSLMKTKAKPVAPKSFQLDDESSSSERDVCKVNEPCHPHFPGVKPTGKGEMGDLEYFHLPIIFKSNVTGFEPTKDLVLEPGNVIAGQYLVENELGSAAFSTAYRCIDLSTDGEDGPEEVCLKVIKNTKDFFDQSLDEIKILELLRQTGQVDENYIIEMKTFFYYREHLVIVTELLRQNLFEFGKFILDNNEEPYFTIPRLAYITRQALIALRFVHNMRLVHSDVKPENILLASYSRAQIKLIDFGSSCYLTDRQSSYIQSRSYRAPEVVLGLPYDGKIDIWSLGCVVAEMYTGEVTFQNDSIVSMLSRIESICGPFPRHMIAQGRQSGRFFTKSGLLYEIVNDSDRDGNSTAPGPHDDDSASDGVVQFDIFQPKKTRLSSRLGFDADLMEDFDEENYISNLSNQGRQEQQMFTDFVCRLLTIDPDGRPTAEEALQHPWMLYAAALTEEQIKYPSS